MLRRGTPPLFGVRWPFTQGGGLGGLALGYYLAAPAGRRTGEPATPADGGIARELVRWTVAAAAEFLR